MTILLPDVDQNSIQQLTRNGALASRGAGLREGVQLLGAVVGRLLVVCWLLLLPTYLILLACLMLFSSSGLSINSRRFLFSIRACLAA